MVWEPEQYVLGNYFQNEVNEEFRKSFKVKPFGTILDVGCGDGQYSNLLVNDIKYGQILGIDSSAEMVRHANQNWGSESLSFEVHNIEEFQSSTAFDFVLSFWCLHWTSVEQSLPKIFHALKEGGRVYAVFSSFSDNSLLQIWHELAKQNLYSDLTDSRLNLSDQYKNYFYRVFNILNKLPFTQINLNLKTTSISLPNIDYFRNFLLSMPFTKTYPSEILEELIDDMLIAFQNICQRKYGGKLYYETRPIFLEAIK